VAKSPQFAFQVLQGYIAVHVFKAQSSAQQLHRLPGADIDFFLSFVKYTAAHTQKILQIYHSLQCKPSLSNFQIVEIKVHSIFSITNEKFKLIRKLYL
jgi:hypothetical protein